MHDFSLKLKKAHNVIFEDVPLLTGRMLFVDSRVERFFIVTPYSYNLTMMMESIFSFLPPYFYII